jgi:hypothetical protein
MMEKDDPCTERLDEPGHSYHLIGSFGFAVFSGAASSCFHFSGLPSTVSILPDPARSVTIPSNHVSDVRFS